MSWASLMAQMVKNLPEMQETQVQSLGREDSLEKGMATHSSILTWRISWTEEPGRLQPRRSERVRHNRATNTSTFHFGEKLHKSGAALKLHLLSRQTPSIRTAGVVGWHGGVLMAAAWGRVLKPPQKLLPPSSHKRPAPPYSFQMF